MLLLLLLLACAPDGQCEGAPGAIRRGDAGSELPSLDRREFLELRPESVIGAQANGSALSVRGEPQPPTLELVERYRAEYRATEDLFFELLREQSAGLPPSGRGRADFVAGLIDATSGSYAPLRLVANTELTELVLQMRSLKQLKPLRADPWPAGARPDVSPASRTNR
jgi:hypothetical protein